MIMGCDGNTILHLPTNTYATALTIGFMRESYTVQESDGVVTVEVEVKGGVGTPVEIDISTRDITFEAMGEWIEETIILLS